MKQPHRPRIKGIRPNLSTILLLMSALFFVFVARVIYSPLLPTIERDLGFNHTQAASIFLFITFGYIGMNIFSGFIASWLGHRTTIFIAMLLVSAATLFVAVSPSVLLIRLGLVVVGIGAGLYPPSGVATVSSLVHSNDEGKVLAIHELGPNLGYILAPLIAAVFLPRLSWRDCLIFLSVVGMTFAILFFVFSRGGEFRGQAPVLRNVSRIFSLPSFWITALLFALGSGASIGLYSLIPTYLVFERSLDPTVVNTIVGVSRISSIIALFFTGYLVDRLGARLMIGIVLFTAGIATAAFWAESRVILLVAVFVQPLLIVTFFPAVLTAAARITPRRMQNLTLSLLLPIAYGFGGGILPLLLGWLGDNVSFALGFLLYGAILTAGSALPLLLKLEHE